MKFLDYKLTVKRQNNNHIVIEGMANAATVDRANELIEPKAWVTDDFKKNPIVLFNHGHDPQFGYMPVGYALEAKATDEGLYTKIKLSNSNTEKIRAVRDLVEEGILKTFSVGFEPLDGTKSSGGDHNVITKAKLIEISIVPIPMNQDSTFSMLSKSYNYVKTNFAKSWITDKILEKDFVARGQLFAAAICKRLSDKEKKRDELILKLIEKSGLSQDQINQIILGDAVALSLETINAFSEVLKIDKLFLETLSKGEVITINSKKEDKMEIEQEQQESQEAKEATEQKIAQIKISKEVHADEAEAAKLVQDAGYKIDKPNHDDLFFVFDQMDLADMNLENAETMEIGDGVFALVLPAEEKACDTEEKPKEEKELDAETQKLIDQYNADVSATEQDKDGNPASWVSDETLWEKAKAASEAAFGEVKFPFVVWWYLNQGGGKKTYIQKADIPPIDDNPYLEQARQTNILLGTLIKEIQGMSVKLDGMPAKQIDRIKEEQQATDEENISDTEKSLLINIRSYQKTISEKLKNIGA